MSYMWKSIKTYFKHPEAIESFVCTVVSISYQYNCLWSSTNKLKEQAGAELCQAQSQSRLPAEADLMLSSMEVPSIFSKLFFVKNLIE